MSPEAPKPPCHHTHTAASGRAPCVYRDSASLQRTSPCCVV